MTTGPAFSVQAKMKFLSSASLAIIIAVAAPGAAFAQDTTAVPAGAPTGSTGDATAPDEAGEILVTGTRVIRDGYKAPTPTTVVGSEEIAKRSPVNLADFVNQLPSLSASTSPRANIASLGTGFTGINALNLRSLGATRTLVLLDGRRVPPSNLGGLVDINTLPQALVKRVDIVTGGASAEWGSDAVSGVVNFVLDKDFTGLKGMIQGGVTTYGDDRSYNASISAGAKFGDGRGHVLLSGEIAHNDGIEGIGERKWYNHSLLFVNPNYTPTNGQPQLLNLPNAGFATATPGGIITTGPLRGTYFGPGGTPAQFNYGSIVSGNVMVGGDYLYSDLGGSQDLDPRASRQSVFGRVSYELTDHLEVFAQGGYNRATTFSRPLYQFNFGNITIQPDNAFIPASIAPRVTAPFNLGTFSQDIGKLYSNTDRSSWVGTVGAKGDFEALGSKWTWDVYGQRQVNDIRIDFYQTVTSRFLQAIDSVRNANGVIVCRSTLTNPTNGCVPYNAFGTGVNSQAAVDYVTGLAWGKTKVSENVIAGTLRGEPFSTWAGPVSIATGIEHRKDSTSGSVDPLRAAVLAAGGSGPYFAGNYTPTFGSFNVTEGFFEAVVPLAKDMPFAKSLDFNGAVRATDYSTSGYVTTWKLGLTYSPVDDLTFRFTRSRDIRAPNLQELFAAGINNLGTIIDRFRGNVSAAVPQVTKGNLNLKPEVADTLGIGAVVQPSFLPGFQASVDYYDIKIKGAISTVNGQAIVDQCFQGNTALCSQITRDSAGALSLVTILPVNIAKQEASGLDFEASYRTPLFGGALTLRGLATRFIKNYSNDGITPATDNVGTNGVNGTLRNTLPKWRYLVNLTYDRDPVTFSVTARGFSAGVYNTSYIECTSNCPASTVANQTINDNHLPGAIYFDTNISAKLTKQVEAFLSVDNILNKDPAQVAFGPAIGAAPLSVNPLLYDLLGRSFRIGVRFKM
ncbi:TonB-dependent receptor domain-containing protein [Flavisphingomonas formosensis]|uniref:TonB-dependent receptor domain-containing protein n=1 Tax=Flavisphingomonas formosensis TaxID=861534 RepID=UPI0012F7CF49|nr:TonB-dependent receptor [Sphingomonas formosensis]